MNGTCYCGTTEGTRLYAGGWRCPVHTPARLAGRPEPGEGRYCAPYRCYCRQCPSWTPDTTYHVGETVIDLAAVKSGKRRSTLAKYRDAQANTTGGAA
jgi:hypothetical protein